VVLPGIVAGFLVTGAVAGWAMTAGAAAAALVSVGLIELVRRFGRVEYGAAMGVVFTAMFAAGVVMLEQSPARGVHLDVEHALYGNLESAVWLDATAWSDLASLDKLAALPASIHYLALVTVIVTAFVVAFFKELEVTTFDPGLADAIGIPSRWMALLLMVVTALAAVAAFDAVGSILVIAMFVCPPATARMLTDRLSAQLVLSAAVAVASGVIGYLAAAFGPGLLGYASSVSAAGMIALVAGLFQLAAMLFAPRYGVLARRRPAMAG
jgi:manganese/zinc/iron transport system permease protein